MAYTDASDNEKEDHDLIRKIIHIDEEKCNGCGACANACHEGAIGMVDGKAKLLRDDYCDGLGDCLPACPTGAITFVEREAAAYDEAAVQAAKKAKGENFHGCPGQPGRGSSTGRRPPGSRRRRQAESQLAQWPLPDPAGAGEGPLLRRGEALGGGGLHRLRLRQLPPGLHAGAGDGHRLSQAGRRGLHGRSSPPSCESNDIRELTIVRMEVPCCGGLEMAAKDALKKQRKVHPLERGHGLGGWKDPGLTGKPVVSSEETGQTERKTRKERAVWRK